MTMRNSVEDRNRIRGKTMSEQHEVEGDRSTNEIVERRLEKIRTIYGYIPLVTEILSRRSDIFIPYSDLTQSVFFKPKHLDRKMVELAAISGATALGSEHCLEVHVDQAYNLGATEGEVFEAMMVGSMMSMTRSQSIAFRKFKYPNPEPDELEPDPPR